MSGTTRLRTERPGAGIRSEGFRDIVVASGVRNMRRHWLRNAVRVAVLVSIDVMIMELCRRTMLSVRGAATGVADAVASFFTVGAALTPMVVPAALLGLVFAGAYGAGDFRRDAARIFGGVTLGTMFAMYGLLWTEPVLSVLVEIGASVGLFGVVVMSGRLFVERVVTRFGPIFGPSRIIVVGDTDLIPDPPGVGFRLYGAPMRVVGSVGLIEDGGQPVGRPVSDLPAVIHETLADTVIVRRPLEPVDFDFVVDQALASGCRLLAGARTTQVSAIEPRPVWAYGEPFVELTMPHLKAWQLFMKRTIDILGSLLGLILFSPFALMIAVAIKLDSRGPVLFSHTRLGSRGRPFKCYKFRSMHPDAEAFLEADSTLYHQYLENDFKLPPSVDPRITRVGRFLRATSLDEVPQLLNVLAGHMSLVGPRPIVEAELDHYGSQAPLFLSLRPGMTGIWAANGRSSVGYPMRVQMELRYVRTWSLLSDITLMLKTIPVVLRRHGAH